MSTQITIRITNNYGNRTVYPVCEVALRLADLIGTKTFTDAACKKLISLGYILNVQQQTF
jgi:hypothetical protein